MRDLGIGPESSPVASGRRVGFAWADVTCFATRRGHGPPANKVQACREGLAADPLVHLDLSLWRSQPYRYCMT